MILCQINSRSIWNCAALLHCLIPTLGLRALLRNRPTDCFVFSPPECKVMCTLSTKGVLFSRRSLQRPLMWEKSSLFNKCHNLDIWNKSRMQHPLVPLAFFCPVLAEVATFWPFQNCQRRDYHCVFVQHLLVCLLAYCISLNSICVSLLCIWAGALFWSVTPLLGWGSYTGLICLTQTCGEEWQALLSEFYIFSLFSDRGYGTCEVDWSKANYSTIHKSYIISILIFCFFIPVMIMLLSYISIIKTVKNTNAMSADGFLTARQRKVERDVTRVRFSFKAFIGKNNLAVWNLVYPSCQTPI